MTRRLFHYTRRRRPLSVDKRQMTDFQYSVATPTAQPPDSRLHARHRRPIISSITELISLTACLVLCGPLTCDTSCRFNEKLSYLSRTDHPSAVLVKSGTIVLKLHLIKCSAAAEMGDRLATIDMGRKFGSCAPFRGAGSPCNTVWPGPRPTFVPSGILIHPAVLATTDMGRKLGTVSLWGWVLI